MALHDDKAQAAIERAQRRLAATQAARIDRALRDISKTPDGREFLWWLLQKGKVGIQPFTANALNTAFQCGELNVGQQILDRILTVNPAVYVQMQQEHLNEYQALVNTDAGVEHRRGGGAEQHPGAYDHPDADPDAS